MKGVNNGSVADAIYDSCENKFPKKEETKSVDVPPHVLGDLESKFEHPYAGAFADIYYDLECNDVFAKKIIPPKKSYGRGPKVLVIATLKNTFKPKFGVTAYPDGNEYAEIEIGTGDVYKISGQCIDLMPLD